MDLRLNATRRSINLSVYLVFDLEAGQFKFLGENLLGAGGVHFPSRVAHSHFDLLLFACQSGFAGLCIGYSDLLSHGVDVARAGRCMFSASSSA